MKSRRTQVDGLKELGEAMRALSQDMALRASYRATAAAARPVKKAAIQNIERSPSVYSGSLRNAVIVKKLGKGKTELTAEHIVTVRGRGSKAQRAKEAVGMRKSNRAPHAHFLEFGTVNMPAEPFLRPALAQNVDVATRAMVTSLRNDIIGKAKTAKKPRKRTKGGAT